MRELLKKIDYTFYDLMLQNKAVVRIVLEQTRKDGRQGKLSWYDYKNQCFGTLTSATKFNEGSTEHLMDAFHIYKWLSNYLNVSLEIEVKVDEKRTTAMLQPHNDDFMILSIKDIDKSILAKLAPLKLKVCNKELNDLE